MKKRTAVFHTDTLMNKYKDSNYDFNKNNDKFHVDLIKIQESDVKIIFFAIFAKENFLPAGNGLKETIQMIDDFHQLINRTNDLEIATDYDDIKRIQKDGKVAAFLAIEGAKSVFNFSALRNFQRLGVSLITLTWNHKNHLAYGINELANDGLTKKGKKFIKEMNRLNIIIDVSHLNPAGFWDVSKLSSYPIVATHSNAKSICDHPRNLTDDQIKTIAETNGIVGGNFYPSFLTNKKNATIKDVFDHINYIKELVGVDYVGLGTDFDGISKTPEGLEHIGKLNKLQHMMEDKGYSEKEIEAISYNNMERVLKRTL
ncbi:MAG: dipeptidase [Halanaerobiales bacterium]|nr:dipeptidase [Halanaerobiales bacterium]